MSKFYVSLVLSVVLSACATTRTPLEPVEIKESMNKDLAHKDYIDEQLVVPDNVNAELLPNSLINSNVSLNVEVPRIDISGKGILAKQFFGSLLKDSKYNLVVHPDVKGRVTLSLKDVTIEEAMDHVADLYGYKIELTGRTYNVYAAGVRTEIIPMNYLFMQRMGISNSSIRSGHISDSATTNSSGGHDLRAERNDGSGVRNSGTEISTKTDTNYWAELERTLLALTSNRAENTVIVSPQSGLVTVRGYPKDIRQVKDYLAQAEKQLQRQVLLEVKIMEVTLSDGYEQGIDWNANTNKVAKTGSFGFNIKQIADTVTGGVLTLATGDIGSLNGANFSAAINLLKKQGDVNVLSSPRVTALNNQKAVIKVGIDDYFVTGYSSKYDAETKRTDNDVQLTPFFSGISLDVTPQIDADGGVLLHVHPSIIDIEDSIKSIKLGSGASGKNIALPTARSGVRETDTVVKAQSGEIIVIGGLMKTAKKELVAKVPFIGDIPFLGELFTNRSQSVSKTELVILIKPIVVDQNTWRLELERSSELLNKWYPEENEKG